MADGTQLRSLADTMSERDLLHNVKQLALLTKWLVYHTYDSRRSDPGFPDLVLVKDRIIFVELKTAKGRLRPQQKIWLAALEDTGAEVYVWRPIDWTNGTIRKVLCHEKEKD
ncbi:MAG: VRR-NUC domain-containing protein [Candidatus Parvarchaeum sp.]